MARDPTHQFRDENPHQGPSHSFGVPHSSEEGTTGREPERERERERGIQSRREPTPRATTTRRASVQSPTYSTFASPFTVMRRLAEDMDRFFDDFASGRRGIPATGFDRDLPRMGTSWSPEIETFRRGDKLVVRADLPGLRKEDLKVDIENHMLTIEGERSEEDRDESDGYYRSERSYGHFYRAIPLPEGVDENACDATFRDGVLEVTLDAPNVAERRGRKVEIR